jgi:hypothetical protein
MTPLKRLSTRTALPLAACALLAGVAGAAAGGPSPYEALGFKAADVLTGTIVNAEVLPGGKKQVVCVATYLTGKSDKEKAVNVKLGVFDTEGDRLVERYVRDLGRERGGLIGNADLNVFDLDHDGMSELIVSFDDFADPLVEQRPGEILAFRNGKFEAVWSGYFEYDATRAARTVPEELRDRYVRDIDFAATLQTRGITLFMNKTMVAVAGERLAEEQVIQETFPLGERRD